MTKASFLVLVLLIGCTSAAERHRANVAAPEMLATVTAPVEDIRQFLDALKVERVHLVGHSMAGDEITRFATLHPHRVGRVVYLDAAYDRRRMLELMLTDVS